jgi:hypothetical protein
MGINALVDNAIGLAKQNPLATAAGIGVVALGAGVATGAVIGATTKRKARKSRRSRKRITHTRRGWKQDRKRKSKQKWEVAYRKRKKMKSKRRGKIHYARKTGQPYIILASGKAKFIKGKRRK